MPQIKTHILEKGCYKKFVFKQLLKILQLVNTGWGINMETNFQY